MGKERDGNNFIARIKTDYIFRAFIFSALSFFVTVVFTAYNAFLGIVYKSVWNIGIFVYYALLLCIRAYVIFSERKFYKNGLTGGRLEEKRSKILLVQSVLLVVTDLALIAPVTFMVLQKKAVNYSAIPAITTAAYTTYKIILSVRNVVKARKERHLSLKILRTINFVDALVSVLTLQYTLIMTFGGGEDRNMFVLCAVTSFIVWAVILFISLFSLTQAVKLRKKNR